MREVVNKGQNCVAVEQQTFTGTAVRNVGQLVGRDVQLLGKNPVSYTHLDVYKRQVPILEHGQCQTQAVAAHHAVPFKYTDTAPVSYTHLSI